MKKLIVSLLPAFLFLLTSQSFAIQNDRDIYGVYIETKSKEEQKQVESFLSQLKKTHRIEVVTNDCPLKNIKNESPKGSFLSSLEFIRPPSAESSSTYVGKPYDKLTHEYIVSVPDNIDSTSDSNCQGYVFMHTDKSLIDCNLEVGNAEQFQKFIKNIDHNIEKIVKSNKNSNKPLLIFFESNQSS